MYTPSFQGQSKSNTSTLPTASLEVRSEKSCDLTKDPHDESAGHHWTSMLSDYIFRHTLSLVPSSGATVSSSLSTLYSGSHNSI